MKVVVIGGGISGLAAAHALRERDGSLEVVVLEGAGRPGGKAWTLHEEGYLFEAGPNGFLDNVPATFALARTVGLGDRIQVSDDAAQRRFVYFDDRLHRVPEAPSQLLTTDVLSWVAKLRLAAEPIIPPRRDGVDESLASFARRRLGSEAEHRLVGPMAAGIYAGDPERLSVAAAFPKVVALEREHGSLIRGALALLWRRRGERSTAAAEGGVQVGPGGRLTSFVGGLRELTQRLAERLGPSLRLDSPVSQIVEAQEGGWAVELSTGEALAADVVIVTAPAHDAARMLEPTDTELAALLRSIPVAPVVVVVLGFDRAALGANDLDGFGFLVVRGQGVRLLGCLWSSSIFPGRAPRGRALLRCIAGGALDPDLIALDDEAILRIVREDLRATMGVRGAPSFVRILRYPRGIPQYDIGHLDRVARIDRTAARHPGLLLSGNSLRGIAFNACIDEAPRLAQRALAELARNA